MTFQRDTSEWNKSENKYWNSFTNTIASQFRGWMGNIYIQWIGYNHSNLLTSLDILVMYDYILLFSK